MIPILYEKTETAFTSNGLGRLPDCISCIVTEERNGIYEVELEYPVSGVLFREIQIGRIIGCTHDEEGNIQPFDIYSKSEPINGIVTINAHHISYRLNEITVEPFTAQNCAAALAGLKTNSIGTNPFDFDTNKDVNKTYKITVPSSCRSMLGGVENSILDVFGAGDYEWDKFNIYLWKNRGNDTDVSIRYGKNLVEFDNELDYGDSYNAIAPYWYGQINDEATGTSEEALVTLTEKYISSGQSLPNGRLVIVPMDCSGDFQYKPTEAELRNTATTRLTNGYAWQPSQNVTIDFVQLWQTEEYKAFAPLQKVKLCDTVLIDVPMYNISGMRIKVIRVVWNVLLDRYDEMELGTPQITLAGAISKDLPSMEEIEKLKKIVETNKAITDNTNQHFWFTGTGTDTGAHITRIERELFLDNPYAGGENLLLRSNGIACRDGMTEVAVFGANGARIGKAAESHIDLDYHSFDVVDKEGNKYFLVADLRDNTGVGTVTETWTGNDTDTVFSLNATATDTNYTVTVDGTAVSPQSKTTTKFILSPAPATGSIVQVTYTSTSQRLKYYTSGLRSSGSVIGMMSSAEGYDVVSSGFCSHAEGGLTKAISEDAHAEGHLTKASGRRAHAEGYETEASGWESHAEGWHTTASDAGTHSEGSHTTSSGYASHAGGGYSTASGTYSFAHGDHVEASKVNQFVIGEYNEIESGSHTARGNYYFIIGNGTNENNRKNIFTVDAYGNVNIASGASYYVNGSLLLDKFTRSSAGTLDWTTQAEGNSKVIAKSALAWWDGRYNGSGSNLQFCAFGKILGEKTSTGKFSFVPIYGDEYVNYGGCYYEKYGRIVHIHVGLMNLTAGSPVTIYKLPAAYRPSTTIFAHGTGGAWNSLGYLEIRTDGSVYVRSEGAYCGADAIYMV